MVAGDDLTGSLLDHAVALRRYQNGLVGETSGLFAEVGERLKALLLRLDPTAVLPGWLPARLRRLTDASAELLASTYADVARLLGDRLVTLGEVESEFAARLLERTASGVSIRVHQSGVGVRQWRAIVLEDPIQGAVTKDWWAQQEASARFAFRRQIQLGMADGEGIDAIVRRVRGRAIKPGVYQGGVIPTSTNEAAGVVRTAVNQIATRAQKDTYEANGDITKEYIYTATLDDRTTPICRSLDGRRFRYKDGPMPPQHWGCRSSIRPVIDWEAEGLKAPPPGQRAAQGGPVPATWDYTTWLRAQSQEVQDRILGPARAKLFRAGTVTLRDLVRQDGRQYTLEQLRERLAS